jgi:transposase
MKTPGTAKERECRRHRAMALVHRGLSAAQVGAQLGVDPRTIRRWKQAFRRRGKAGLRVQPATGATPKLSAGQRCGLRRRLMAGALAQGFTTDLWTCPRVARLIERLYGVRYHVDHIPYVMRSLGFSVQKPETRARERDEPAIQHWIEHDWPRIKKRRPDDKPRWFSSTKQAFF